MTTHYNLLKIQLLRTSNILNPHYIPTIISLQPKTNIPSTNSPAIQPLPQNLTSQPPLTWYSLTHHWTKVPTYLILNYMSLINLYWYDIIVRLSKAPRLKRLLKLFKFNLYSIIHILLMCQLKKPLDIWTPLKLILWRVNPRRQKFWLFNFIRLLTILFNIFKPYTSIVGYFFKIKGKIGRAGSVRKKRFKYITGQHKLYNTNIFFNKQIIHAKTPAGVIGITFMLHFKAKFIPLLNYLHLKFNICT